MGVCPYWKYPNQGGDGEAKVWRTQPKNQEEDTAEERITEKSRLKYQS